MSNATSAERTVGVSYRGCEEVKGECIIHRSGNKKEGPYFVCTSQRDYLGTI